MATLSTHVWVEDSKGRRVLLTPGEDVPAWAVGLIRNPRAWADAEPPAPESPAPESPAPMGAAEVFPEMVDNTPVPVGTPPPRNGKGSSRAAWAEYATRNGLAVTAEAQRDDIVERLDEAGIPT